MTLTALFERREVPMQQRRLTLVRPMFGLVLVAVSASNVNAVNCIAKPNGQPSQGQHWFYRTDRVTQRQCWYLAPQNADAQKSAMRQLSSTHKLPAAPRQVQRATAAAAQVVNVASAAETDVPSPAVAALAEAAKLSDVPPSIAPAPQPTLAESSSADATSPVTAPATNDAEEPQSPINAEASQVATAAQAGGEVPSSLLVVTLALLAMVGPVFYAVRWLHRRKASDRWGLGRASPGTGAQYNSPPEPLKQSEKEVALALQQLLDDTQTKPNVELLDQTGQLAQELQQFLNEAQTKQCASSQTEQLADALKILRDRDSQRVERHHDQLASAADAPLRSRDLLLANQRK